MDLDGFEGIIHADLGESLDHVRRSLRILRGPKVPASMDTMRLEMYLTQAESFLSQAVQLLEER